MKIFKTTAQKLYGGVEEKHWTNKDAACRWWVDKHAKIYSGTGKTEQELMQIADDNLEVIEVLEEY